MQQESQGQQGQGCNSLQDGWARAQEARAWGRVWSRSPQKGLFCQVLQVVQGGGRALYHYDTIECCRFEKDGKPKDKPAKPFDSAKTPWKKTGSRDSSQMAYLTEKVAKLKKKLKKTNKHVKKHARDSLDSDSDSD